jgi:hypothetical protein
MKRKPIYSGICVAVMFLAICLVFLLDDNLGGNIDMHLRYVLSFVGLALVIVAFILHERTIWLILGLLLTSIYIGLHFIAVP